MGTHPFVKLALAGDPLGCTEGDPLGLLAPFESMLSCGPAYLWTQDFSTAQLIPGATHARASTQLVETDTGALFEVPVDAIPIRGARPAYNRAVSIASLIVPATGSRTSGVADSDGGTDGYRLKAVSGSPTFYYSTSANAAETVSTSIYIRRVTGSGAVYLYGSNNALLNISASLTSEYQRFNISAQNTSSFNIKIYIGTVGDEIDVCFYQEQDITHRAALSTAPDEFIDPDTDYGTGVNGFAYFTTALANTVDGSGVVTEATGAALTGIALANVPGATNLADGTHDFSGGADTITLSSTGYYTLWLMGTAQVTIAAGTATITGAGSATEGSPVTINCTATGTVTLTLDSGTLDSQAGKQIINLHAGTVPISWIPTDGSTASTDAAVIDFSGVTGFTTPNETRIVATGLGACELQDPSFDSDGSDWSDTGTITSSYDDGAVTLVNAAGYDGIYQNTVAPIPIGTTLLYVIDVKSISGGTITLQGKGVLNVGGATFSIASESVVGVFAGIKITTSVINSIAVRNSTAGTTTVVNGVYVFEIDPTSDVETIIDVDNWDGTDLSDILPHANVISVTQYAPGDRP